jgi:hypothetical protein
MSDSTSSRLARGVMQGVMHNHLFDLGNGKENANALMYTMLTTILREARGHTTMVFFLDCCGVGRCSAINWFVHWVVDDLKLLRALGVEYFATSHGKGPANGRFGAHLRMYRKGTALSLDSYGAHMLATVGNKQTGVRDTVSIIHYWGMSDIAEYASRCTGVDTGGKLSDPLVPLPSWFGFKKGDQHCVWAVRDNHLMTGDMGHYLEELRTPKGWVATRHKPSSPPRYFCFLPGSRSSAPEMPRPCHKSPSWDVAAEAGGAAGAADQREEATEATREGDALGEKQLTTQLKKPAEEAKLNASQYLRNGHNFSLRTDIMDVAKLQNTLHLWPAGYLEAPLACAAAMSSTERTPSIDVGLYPSLLCLQIMSKKPLDPRPIFKDHRPSDALHLPFFLDEPRCLPVRSLLVCSSPAFSVPRSQRDQRGSSAVCREIGGPNHPGRY